VPNFFIFIFIFLNQFLFNSIDEDYGTEAITEDHLKKMYSNANRQENLEVLLNLTFNQSHLQMEDTFLRAKWLTKPETLGDVAIIQILNIIQKKVKGLILDQRELENNANTDKEKINPTQKEMFKNKIENMIDLMNKLDFINKMVEMLDSESNTKKDCSILILCTMSGCKSLLGLMMNREFLKSLILHINRFKKASKK